MIELTRGNLLDAPTDALVNPVNCVGAMGRGLAVAFRNAFPANFAAYKAACLASNLRPGTLLTFDRGISEKPRYVVNFPTKNHWRSPSTLPYIETGLVALIADVERLQIRSLAIPALGCGLGGLDWNDVRPCIEAAFAPLPDIHVLLYEPVDIPDASV